MQKTNEEVVQLTEAEKTEFIEEFFDNVEILLEKKRFAKRARLTKIKVKDRISTWPHGKKKEFVVTHKKAELTFTVEVRPWLWNENTVWVGIDFIEAKKLSIPKKMITPKTQGNIWKAKFDPIFFLQNTDSVMNYIQAVELTPLDVGLFDSVKAAAENFFGK